VPAQEGLQVVDTDCIENETALIDTLFNHNTRHKCKQYTVILYYSLATACTLFTSDNRMGCQRVDNS